MSFFNKLKNRLFKSSSKIEEGLDAIVEDGGVEEKVEETNSALAEAEQAARLEEEAAEAARLEEEARVAHEAEVARTEQVAEAVRLAEEKRQAEIEAARLEKEEAERAALAQQLAREEAERVAAAQAAHVAAAEAAKRAEAEQQEQAERLAREAREAKEEAVRLAQDAAAAEAAREAEAVRLAQEKAERDAAAEAAAEADRVAQEQARTEEAARLAEERRLEIERLEREERIEAERIAKENQIAEAARLEAEKRAAEAAAALSEDITQAPAPEKRGLMGRLFGGRNSEPKTVVRRALDDAMLESLEDLLITADMGVETAMRVSANLAEGRFGKKLSTAEIKSLLSTEVARIMEPVAKPMPLYAKRPQVVLVVGVNGSGKTTTIGKLASQFKAAGKSVVIAAGDTFRAAAVEQLQVWGERAGVPVLTAPEGSDPASLAFDAMERAEADGADLLMIDTAGRLQNRQDLMEELAKIVRVIRKKDPDAPHNTLLVLDATTGQNALSQVEVFQKISDVSGLVMTKLDGTAKGGVLVALADKFGLPIHAIGVGEQIDDLAPFDPEEFAQALTGHEG